MNPDSWTDQHVVALIKDVKTRDKALYVIFHQLDWRGAAVAFVKKNGGDEQDGLAVAAEALIALDCNIRNDRFKSESSLKTYFLSIVRNQWFKLLRGKKPMKELDANAPETGTESVEESYLREEYHESIRKVLENFKGNCGQIFKMVMLGAMMKEIAIALNLANADMAKKAYYRCRMAFREFTEQYPDWWGGLK